MFRTKTALKCWSSQKIATNIRGQIQIIRQIFLHTFLVNNCTNLRDTVANFMTVCPKHAKVGTLWVRFSVLVEKNTFTSTLEISSISMAQLDQLKKELKKEFPSIDKDLQSYVESN
jgi:hypothetical protein